MLYYVDRQDFICARVIESKFVEVAYNVRLEAATARRYVYVDIAFQDFIPATSIN